MDTNKISLNLRMYVHTYTYRYPNKISLNFHSKSFAACGYPDKLKHVLPLQHALPPNRKVHLLTCICEDLSLLVLLTRCWHALLAADMHMQILVPGNLQAFACLILIKPSTSPLAYMCPHTHIAMCSSCSCCYMCPHTHTAICVLNTHTAMCPHTRTAIRALVIILMYVSMGACKLTYT
jgi:hypothetical protein